MRQKTGKVFKTPFGWSGVAVSERGIAKVVLPRAAKEAVNREIRGAAAACSVSPVALNKAVKQLERYFSGTAVSFGLPLDLRHATAFQRAVWRVCATVPFGETRSYGWIAKRLGKPNASRAVGQAMGANPIPILVP